VHRRDLLRLRVATGARSMDLSCQALHMQYLDLQRRADHDTSATPAYYEEPWLGEPPAVSSARGLAELFAELSRQIEGVDVLRVVDAAWITDDDLSRELDRLVATFVARGGRVE
jgi:hypothetical protein